MSLKNKLFKEKFKMSSASQHEGPITQAQLLDPTQPTKNWKISTQPMGRPNPWTTLADTGRRISQSQRWLAG